MVTGHTGFKGSWLVSWLLRAGARVGGYSLTPGPGPSLFRELGLAKRVQHHIGDIRSPEKLIKAVKDADPQIVFHLAAQPLVRESYRSPVQTYAVNVLGTVNLLQAVRLTKGVKVVINVTTDKVYANDEKGVGFSEHAPLGGHDPYSSSKACSELVTQSYRDSFFSKESAVCSVPVRVATARSGNVVGGGDWAHDRLIPDLARAFEANSEALVRNPGAVRPWQHVLEPLHGYLLLAESLWFSPDNATSWNFGPASRLSRNVGWMADMFVREWGDGARWRADRRKHPPEARLLKLDSRRAAAKLGWNCRLSIGQTVRWTAEWYKQRCSGDCVRDLTERQLAEYEKLVSSARS